VLAERFSTFLHRWRFAVLGAWTLHAFLLHWFVIGFLSWDGLAYRVPPVIELVQHGSLGLWKYEQWAFAGYVPFVELVHAPFVYLFKLPGIIIGFPLFLFPLCVVAVYLFVRELTGEKRAGVFGALGYAAIPFVNEQPYSGYIDFAVIGLLAFFLYAVVRLRTARRGVGSFVCVVVATAFYTMSRAQGVYVVIMLSPFLTYALFCERERFRVRIVKRAELLFAMAGAALGSIPSIAIQIMKYREHGTPTYPFQFSVLGIKIGEGVTLKTLFFYGGLKEETLSEFATTFAGGWLWPRVWPIGGLFDSKHMGGGFVLCVALALLPVFVRRASRAEKWIAVGCIAVSLIARDFWLPRYAYTLIIALVMVIGRAMSELAVLRRGAVQFWSAAVVLLAHLARPEFDIAMIPRDIGIRLNVTGSTMFRPGPYTIEIYPDVNGRFVIIGTMNLAFVLQLYGRRLTNEVLRSVPVAEIGEGCANLVAMSVQQPDVLFIDESDATKACAARECAIRASWGMCMAYRIK
jgi:Dolichyl-phosphate-mannose-protein mannosyltransferase